MMLRSKGLLPQLMPTNCSAAKQLPQGLRSASIGAKRMPLAHSAYIIISKLSISVTILTYGSVFFKKCGQKKSVKLSFVSFGTSNFSSNGIHIPLWNNVRETAPAYLMPACIVRD